VHANSDIDNADHERPGRNRPTSCPTSPSRICRTVLTFGTIRSWISGTRGVSTTKQDLHRQIVALEAAGIPSERIYVDKKSGATTNRPGLQAAMGYARAGDVIVVDTLDRLGRTVRDTLNLIHDLAARCVGIRNISDPIKVDSSNPADPMAQLAVVLLGCSPRWNAPTVSSAPPAPARPRPRKAGASAGLASSTRQARLCRAPAPLSPRSSPRPASPAPASTATCHHAQPSRSPPPETASSHHAPTPSRPHATRAQTSKAPPGPRICPGLADLSGTDHRTPRDPRHSTWSDRHRCCCPAVPTPRRRAGRRAAGRTSDNHPVERIQVQSAVRTGRFDSPIDTVAPASDLQRRAQL
jgi:hypothetical protein